MFLACQCKVGTLCACRILRVLPGFLMYCTCDSVLHCGNCFSFPPTSVFTSASFVASPELSGIFLSSSFIWTMFVLVGPVNCVHGPCSLQTRWLHQPRIMLAIAGSDKYFETTRVEQHSLVYNCFKVGAQGAGPAVDYLHTYAGALWEEGLSGVTAPR